MWDGIIFSLSMLPHRLVIFGKGDYNHNAITTSIPPTVLVTGDWLLGTGD
jgi:hypothetical protein